MQKNKLYVTIFITVLSVASVSLILSIMFTYNVPEVRDYVGIDGTPLLEGKMANTAGSLQSSGDGTLWPVTVSDDYLMENYEQEFELVLVSDKCDIWIGLNPEVHDGGFQDHYVAGNCFENDTWYFAYPWSEEGIAANRAHAPDPDEDGYYLPPEYMDWITGQDLLNIAYQFDNNIHDGVTEHFGDYNASRLGPLGDGKIQVLIFNMRDGLFYDPYKSGWFIMGYFWSVISEANDANIFHMDTYQWWRRAGTPTVEWFGLSPLPLQYDGTFAHEFEHLVHYDVDPDELSWVDEGCATLAEWVCGYGFSPGHISEYLLNHHTDSLTIWQSELADYGGVFLWTYYMWEHYGEDSLIWDLTHEQKDGIEGWTEILPTYTTKTFDEIFHDWMLANYFDDTSLSVDGVYGYYGLDIPSDDSAGYSIHSILEATPALYDKSVRSGDYSDTTLPYTANYIEFHNHPGTVEIDLTFDGDDTSGVEAHSGDLKMSSNGEFWAWYRFHQDFDLTGLSTATLNFWTLYEIEADWDYGYVEVYCDGAWSTLEGSTTVSTLTEQENPNCPNEYEPTTYLSAECWYAYTGSSGGWIQEEMDLTEFAGHEIEIYFTYWTDGYVLDGGWFVDDIEVTGEPLWDFESGTGDWIVDDGWTCDMTLHDNNFEVDLITIADGVPSFETLPLDEAQVGTASFELFKSQESETYVLMVVANQPGFIHTFATSYEWTILRL